MNEDKPVSSQWPLSLVDSWQDSSPDPTLAASKGITDISALFHLSSAILFLSFSMTAAVHAYSGFNPALSSFFSPSLLFRIPLICLRQDSGIPVAFFPEVLRALKLSPLAPEGLILCSLPFSLERTISLGCAFIICCGKGSTTAAPGQRCGLWKVI